MQLKISELRTIINEELDRCIRWSAGITGGGGNVGKGVQPAGPPGALGSPEEEDALTIDPEESGEDLTLPLYLDRPRGSSL